MRIGRRFPLYTRPLPFLAGSLMLGLGVWFGLGWTWRVNRFSGNILFRVNVPDLDNGLLAWTDPTHAPWLWAAIAGFVILFFFSFGTRRAVRRRRALGPRWRFYPLVACLGLFLLYFGIVYLFDLGLLFDKTDTGFVAFITLDYVGLISRFVLGTIGLILVGLGIALLFFGTLSFQLGLGRRPMVVAAAARPRTPPAAVAHVRRVRTARPRARPVEREPDDDYL